MGKVKRLDLKGKPEFMANGHKYILSEQLSVERWRKFEDLQALVGLGRSFSDVFDNVKKAFEALNESKPADAAIQLHNILTGIKDKLDQRHTPALLMCALFINRDDEDDAEWNEKLMNEKINDWTEEGYAVNDFFQLAWNFVPGFTDAYSSDLENTLQTLFQNKQDGSKKKK